MPTRVAIPVTDIVRTGAGEPAQTNGDATNNHYIANNDGRIFFQVVSSDAGTQTVTVETPGTVDGLAIADLVVSISAGATKYIGPFTTGTFNQSDGSIYVNPSVSTNLKFRAFRLP